MRASSPRALLRIVVALAIVLATSSARAHLMPAKQGSLKIDGADAYLVLSLPIAAFAGLDANGDGLVDAAELEARAPDVARVLRDRIALESPNGDATRATLDFTLGEHAGEQVMPSTHIVVLEHFVFASAPSEITLRADVLALAPGADSITLRARRGAESDMVVLGPDHPTRTLFPGTMGTLRDAGTLGVHHILGGADHLVFLVALLAAGAGVRRWLILLSTFTVAHSVSLALSAFGLLHASARMVEPLIAASIAIVALKGLRRSEAPASTSLAAESTLVFACGLLHGLGFSSALGELGLEGSRRIVSLAGFNAGIEMGQAMFALGVLVVIALAKRVVPGLVDRAPKRLASAVALVLGACFFVRVLASMT